MQEEAADTLQNAGGPWAGKHPCFPFRLPVREEKGGCRGPFSRDT